MCSFLVNDTILPSDNPLCFRKILSEQIYNKTMTIDYQIKDEKQQYDINREATKNQPYRQAKLINTNISQVTKFCPIIKSK